MKLTRIERLVLFNQLEILKHLQPTRQASLENAQEVLSRGYEPFYGEVVLGHLYEEGVSDQQADFVYDVLNMFDALQRFEAASGEKLDEYAARFAGFDGNSEGALVAFTEFVVERMGRWDYLKIKNFNSHMSSEVYGRMLEVWKQIDPQQRYKLTRAEVDAILRNQLTERTGRPGGPRQTRPAHDTPGPAVNRPGRGDRGGSRPGDAGWPERPGASVSVLRAIAAHRRSRIHATLHNHHSCNNDTDRSERYSFSGWAHRARSSSVTPHPCPAQHGGAFLSISRLSLPLPHVRGAPTFCRSRAIARFAKVSYRAAISSKHFRLSASGSPSARVLLYSASFRQTTAEDDLGTQSQCGSE